MSKSFEELLKEANSAIEAIGVLNKKLTLIQKKGTKCLYCRGTLPPKPGSKKLEWHQQEIALGLRATPQGLQVAQKKVIEILALLEEGKFDWQPYVRHKRAVQHNSTATIAE